MEGDYISQDLDKDSLGTTEQPSPHADFNMTLVFNSIGQLIQGQFGLNELASAVVVGKTVGSIISRKTDGKSIQTLAETYPSISRPLGSTGWEPFLGEDRKDSRYRTF
jgi:hypothetical protein